MSRIDFLKEIFEGNVSSVSVSVYINNIVNQLDKEQVDKLSLASNVIGRINRVRVIDL